MHTQTADDYAQHWDEKFRTRAWGRYPPEDLVRFMGRHYKHAQKDAVRVLEVGCGPGANIWFLHREGFAVSAIDISPTGIDLAGERLRTENRGLNTVEPDLKVGNFAVLPWPDNHFDVVVDIFSLCANTVPVISQVVSEITRVLKPGGQLYSKSFGRNTTGYGGGTEIEPGTYDAIPSGPMHGMGIIHFFDHEDAKRVFGKGLTPVAIDVTTRSDVAAGNQIEELHCHFKKAG